MSNPNLLIAQWVTNGPYGGGVRCFTMNGSHFYAGTDGAGVYVSTNNGTNSFQLPRWTEVRLSVFDMLGREVSVLVNEGRNAGVHEVKFDGSGLASGVYFYKIQAGDFVQARRMLVVK